VSTAPGKKTPQQVQQEFGRVPAQDTPAKDYDEKVIVACKVPLSWLELQLEHPRTIVEEGKFGSKEVTVWEKSGDIVRVRGTAYPSGQPPEGFIDRPEKMFGYAITRDVVTKKFWDEFCKQKAGWPPLKNGFIFAFRSMEDVKARARENQGLKSGFEPMDPKGDTRNPKPMNGALTPLTVEEERGKKMPALG
jgi:hypothetical protein